MVKSFKKKLHEPMALNLGICHLILHFFQDLLTLTFLTARSSMGKKLEHGILWKVLKI